MDDLFRNKLNELDLICKQMNDLIQEYVINVDNEKEVLSLADLNSTIDSVENSITDFQQLKKWI